MQPLIPLAERVAAGLTDRGGTVAVAESAAGGLISAALLAVPGASAYFLGGAVVYTAAAREALLGIAAEEMEGLRPASESYAALMAERIAARHGAVWGLSETGAAGPSGNRYGDPAGHVCIAVFGPAGGTHTLRTGRADRGANMRAFAAAALEHLALAIEAS